MGDFIGLLLIAVLLAAIRRSRVAMIVFCGALGVASAIGQARIPRAAVSENRFVSIQAPIDRDWTRRDDVFVIRVSRFAVRDSQFNEELTIYARFGPKPIGMQKWIHAEGFLRRNDRGELTLTVKSPRLLSYGGTLSLIDPAAWNRALANRLRPLAATYPTEIALIEALALGRGERLGEEVRNNYKRGGTYHLLVFSGLQIAFAAGVIAMLLRSLHAPRISDWLLLVFAVVAPMFIGRTASVSRASIGIGLFALSRLLKRPTSLENLWCVAALLRLIVAPGDLADAAFQLTYAGAGALMFVGRPLSRRRGRWVMVAVGAECAVTPLTLFHFHQYALGGSFTTLLLTPVVFAMLVVSALACVVPAPLLMHLVGFLHHLCTRVNDLASPLAGAYAAPPLITVAVGFGAALIAIALLRDRARAYAILLALLVPVIGAIVVARQDVLRPSLTVLDVGQGDAIVLRTPGHAVLIDAGSRYSNVVPLLLDRGIRHLDAAVLTHVHPDHCGGLPDVVARLDVEQLWISPRRFQGECAQRLLDAASTTSVPIHLVRDGEARAFGNVSLRAFVAGRTFKRAAENNSSVVLRAIIGRRALLLTGDIEREAEEELAGRLVRADVLKVAHHGSRSSTTAPFVDSVAPRIALISCGRRNLFGHPHAGVLDVLRRTRIYRTDLDGSIEVTVDGHHIFVQREIDTPP